MNVSQMLSPDQLLGQLFRDVQLGQVFPDQKTFVDCVPNDDPARIVAAYEQTRHEPGFDLSAFVHYHFTVPEAVASDYVSDTSQPTAEHINRLWGRLTRSADVPVPHDSRVALPKPYVVPGGRFREIFYWDSYFTMLGLRKTGETDRTRYDLIRNMIANFAYLIENVGFIPNGNRTYFLSRSQPPFFALMVQLLADIDGPTVLETYLPHLFQEYTFWMNGTAALTHDVPVQKRVVALATNHVLNRYWDTKNTPRPEAYRQELELTTEAEALGTMAADHSPEVLYTHIRAACESGWDFSSRWLADGNTLATIHAADIVPVDLNCLLYTLEDTLAKAYEQVGKQELAMSARRAADQRRAAILETCWHEPDGFFYDYDFAHSRLTNVPTLAAAFPLFVGIANPTQAERVHTYLKTHFLQAGGWVTTLQQTGQQWDWPNGWAPLQWVVYQGLLNYGFTDTAHTARDRWLALNDKVFKATGKMTEKYNVADAALTTGGGEYPNQDGFGWTNGVYLAMLP